MKTETDTLGPIHEALKNYLHMGGGVAGHLLVCRGCMQACMLLEHGGAHRVRSCTQSLAGSH